MVLRYLYAALSALLNPWSIFSHPTLLLWTKSLSSSFFPRLFLPSTPDVPSLDPVSPILTEKATSLNASLTSLNYLILPPIDVHHPLTETFHLFRGALVSIPHFSSPRFYSILLVAAAMIVFGLYLLRHWFLFDRSFKSALPSVYHIPFAIALAMVESLGDIDDDTATSEQSVHTDLVPAPPLCTSGALQPPVNTAVQTVEHPLPISPSVARSALKSPPQVSATPATPGDAVHHGPPESPDGQILADSIQSCAPHTPEHNPAPPIVVDDDPKPSAHPFASPSSVAETTSPYFSFPPSPCLPTEDPSLSLGCSTISEDPTLFPDVDVLKIGTLIQSENTPERPSVINYDLGNVSKSKSDLDPTGAAVSGSHGTTPSQLAPSQGSS